MTENSPRPRILLADAHADYRDLVCHYLAHLKYPCPAQAKDGREAVSMALSQEPDLIIMEPCLPKLHGFEILAQLRRDQRTSRAWIVAATAMAMPGDREICLGKGFDAYLAKPFTLKEFEDLLLAASAGARAQPGL
ncbi:MAG TPA: response regulator [Candidatus Binatia bacterium]|jgi:CheY-like chemotaxis protein